MVKIKSDGAYTVVRRVRKDGNARGTMYKDNLNEALANGQGNIVVRDKKTKR